jgi:hypothetical protein
MVDLAAPIRWLGLVALAGIVALVPARPAAHAGPAPHDNPRAYCARVGTDDTLRTPPPALAGAIKRLFNVSGRYALKTTYYRCAGGDVEVCWVGANLPCGKANTDKHLPAATRWCQSHANSDFIPLYVTGHDTPYSWRCAGAKAEAGAPVGKLDARGFFEEYWKKL